MLKLFKKLLTDIGGVVSDNAIVQIQATVNYIAIGRWMKKRSYVFPWRLPARRDVWREMLKIAADRKVLYLEFGVYRGTATRFWSEGLKHPGAILHGFDSFEGLPDDAGPWKEGQFDVAGQLPQIGDSRVRFFKGWFNETLPTYSAPPHDLLVINMDADLYSSTVCVFDHVGKLIKPGTLIYFDEMNHVQHEPKAFDELIKRTGLKFRPIAADKTLAHVAFECVA